MTSSLGGVISGSNPFIYNSGSPLTLFLFQACLILATCNLLHIPFAKIRQPKVISEVIAGIILGPTAFGQIPNYMTTVFPKSSIPGLNLTANLGIILFMFFLGLEVDTGFIKKHLKTALSIGLVTLAVPFGFGCLFSIPLYHSYGKESADAGHTKFTVFMVFIATSISVTAFPVLCRILNELRLIKDRAGIIVLGAGIINDILGWVLLALSVILSSASSDPVNTVYILLCTLGWFLLYTYPLKYLLSWVLRKTHELERPKPSPLGTMCILFVMFISAYFTDIIGVHPIFGAFIAGLIVPRENNYVVKLAERMEDIPNIVLIPIYFAVAGLQADLTLLNQGRDWGYIFASIGIAIGSKIVSGSLLSQVFGLFWRESLAVGILMSCKGIVEIVVLSVGLNAGIIDEKVYGMFILMALVSTFVTTPMTLVAYPDSYRNELQARLMKKELGEEDSLPDNSDAKTEGETAEVGLTSFSDAKNYHISEIVNIINTTETISSSLDLINRLANTGNAMPTDLVSDNIKATSPRSSTSTIKPPISRFKKFTHVWTRNDHADLNTLAVIEENEYGFELAVPVKGIHLRLLTERTADLLQSSSMYNDDLNFTANTDSILQIFDIFCRLSKIQFSSEVIYSTVREKATNISSLRLKENDLVLLSLKGASHETNAGRITRRHFYQNFEDIYLHILGLNELPSSFFQTVASSLSSNFSMLISNSLDRLNADSFMKKSFYLLFPSPNLASSDFLALHLFLVICRTNFRNGDDAQVTIFVNEENIHFTDQLMHVLCDQDWISSALKIVNISIDPKTEQSNTEGFFVDAVLKNGLSDKEYNSLEEATFIMAENYFFGDQPFSDEVKATILRGSNNCFDVLVVHHHCP
ncbi:probable K(+)/H(+) antiporter 1 [Zygosaccharomyces bailii]|nr:probable K(+)/H(+) antiporter 1 [Zygosaccharomyces bailii]